MMKLFDEATLEELDLVLQDMRTVEDEKTVQDVLESISGVQAARIVPEGAWIRYESSQVTKEDVCEALTEAGYTPQLFQDSLSGETDEVSQD